MPGTSEMADAPHMSGSRKLPSHLRSCHGVPGKYPVKFRWPIKFAPFIALAAIFTGTVIVERWLKLPDQWDNLPN